MAAVMSHADVIQAVSDGAQLFDAIFVLGGGVPLGLVSPYVLIVPN